MKFLDKIVTDSQISAGKPCLRGTDLTVDFISELLASGWDYSHIQKEYKIEFEDILAVLEYTHRLTYDKIKLLYIINKYSIYDESEGKIMWAKEMTILTAIFRVLRHDLPFQQQILTIKYREKSNSENSEDLEALKKKKIFDLYRFTPMYRIYQGTRRLMNICVDAIEDMAEMVKDNLIQKFKIGTARFTFENSFILTPSGYQVLKIYASDDDPTTKAWKDEIEKRLSCPECHQPADIVLLEDKIGFLCQKAKWKHFGPSLIFYMQDFEYETKPFPLFKSGEVK